MPEIKSESSTWAERFALIEGRLADRCAAATPVDPEVAWAPTVMFGKITPIDGT